MSCNNFDTKRFIDEVEERAKRSYGLLLGTFVGKFIGELIDKLRAEEEARSELENKVYELEDEIKKLKRHNEKTRENGR